MTEGNKVQKERVKRVLLKQPKCIFHLKCKPEFVTIRETASAGNAQGTRRFTGTINREVSI